MPTGQSSGFPQLKWTSAVAALESADEHIQIGLFVPLNQMSSWVQKVKETLASIRQSLQKEPKTMEDLKSVLRAIALIRDSAMVKEVAFTDLEERFRQVVRQYCACHRTSPQSAMCSFAMLSVGCINQSITTA